MNGLNATGLRLGEILDSKINLDISYSSLSKLRYSGLKHSLAYCPKDTDSYLSLIDKKARDHIIIIEDKLDGSSFNELAKIIRKAAFDNTDISVVSQFPGSTSNADRNSITEQILGLFEIHSGFSLCITDVLSESHHFLDSSAQSILKNGERSALTIKVKFLMN